MALLAEELIRSGHRSPQIRRQYAQALIDQGFLTAAELLLQSIIQEQQVVASEEIEVRGLIGRIYKQLYVNTSDKNSTRNRANLERSLNEYLYAYRLAPQQNLWHGINVVALLERARRDMVSLESPLDPSTLAREILTTIKTLEDSASSSIPAWDMAIALEALIALGSPADAEAKALEYTVCEDTDTFEIASTLRQLMEVWQLNDREPPGSRLLPILRSALLRKEGASMEIDPKKISRELAIVEETEISLENIFGPDSMQTLTWYKTGLKRCESIARVEKLNGQGHGTGWLVNAADFFPGQEGRSLLLTNAHIVSPTPFPFALFPDQARINFQALGKIFNVKDVVWSSPAGAFDASFLLLDGDLPQAEPLPIEKNPVMMTNPPPRMYVIGHPGGRELEISLQDNYLLACNDRLLHYRTPTEGGSSGSPVFEPLGWRVVALHHGGLNNIERIDGKPGTYEANEGIAIRAIQLAIQYS